MIVCNIYIIYNIDIELCDATHVCDTTHIYPTLVKECHMCDSSVPGLNMLFNRYGMGLR